jgi:hypothetical protein
VTLSLTKTLSLAALCAASALCVAAAPSMASADTRWLVDATFDDGTTLTGTFTINVYGFLESANLETETNGAFTGFDYTTADSYYSNGNFYVDFQPGYTQDLHLEFANTLTTGSQNNLIIGGENGPSYECEGSYSCYIPMGGDTRYIASGFADEVPEPATWALMLAGFGGLGMALRAKQKFATAGGAPSASRRA